jgi:hypothetical protein
MDNARASVAALFDRSRYANPAMVRPNERGTPRSDSAQRVAAAEACRARRNAKRAAAAAKVGG